MKRGREREREREREGERETVESIRRHGEKKEKMRGRC